ncbi:portal protein [Leptospira wolffii]|uniref:TrkH family potassium uptake protein n=1 Tax=Leptospira wolffii TaxID=409998 RepID=UPI001082C848|nr:potassium transporter TrkG [Leptospira wolffii]TGK61564.1 portal protein [Leptospira wolffii]TGK70108.1 portal protein [Leptospira wolffii]TGK77031.1 portal protein [Leptospira wolffii]TGL31117.1 portal protein [Leptospira wolffii]
MVFRERPDFDLSWNRVCLFFQRYIKPTLRYAFGLSGIVSLFILVLLYGFYYPETWVHPLRIGTVCVVWYLVIYEILSFLFTLETYRNYLKLHKVEAFVVMAVVLQFLFEEKIETFISSSKNRTEEVALLFLTISQVTLTLGSLAHFLRRARVSLGRISPSLIMTLSFAFLILVGTAGLCLPKAEARPIPLVDLFFTAVSAVCVTGLSTIDVSVDLTGTGQTILVLLIQLGGLGLMTLTVFFALVLEGQVSVTEKLLVKDLFSQETIGRAGSILRQVAYQTFAIEAVGAILLFVTLPREIGLSEKEIFFHSLFHAISAFCNAGFSLFPKGLADPYLKESYSFLSILMLLIVFGGLGFPTTNQMLNKIRFRGNANRFRFSVGSKLILVVTCFLLLIGWISYWVLERNFTLKDLPWYDGLFHSLFYSVTTRTAGFNTLDIAAMGTPMVFVSLFLMWVGASPNSTGGGIKTSTFALAVLQFYQFLTGKERVDVFGRTIAESSLSRAAVAIVLSLFIIFTGILFLVCFDGGFPFLDLCYEVVSAYGTTGLSRGITPQFGSPGKLLLCAVMFVGRVGVLTVLLAFVPKRKPRHYWYPEEYVVVG